MCGIIANRLKVIQHLYLTTLGYSMRVLCC